MTSSPGRSMWEGERRELRAAFDRARAIARRGDPEVAELWLGVLAALWGLWLVNPWARAFGSSPGFAAMAAVADEETWGVVVLAIGLLEVYAVLESRPRLRRAAALGQSCFWTFVAMMVAAANLAGTGVVVYGAIAALSVYAFLRVPNGR